MPALPPANYPSRQRQRHRDHPSRHPRRPASRPSRRSDDKPEAGTPTTANRPSTQLDHQPTVQEDSRPPACIQAAEPHREPAVQADRLTTSQPTKQTAPITNLTIQASNGPAIHADSLTTSQPSKHTAQGPASLPGRQPHRQSAIRVRIERQNPIQHEKYTSITVQA